MPYSYQMTSGVLYSTQYHRQHCILQAFEHFGALCLHDFRYDRDSNPVLSTEFEPQPDRMSVPALVMIKSVPALIMGSVVATVDILLQKKV